MNRTDTRSAEVQAADEEIAESYERWIVRDPVTGWTDLEATERLRHLNGAIVEVLVDHPETELASGQRGTVLGVSRAVPGSLCVKLDEAKHRVIELPAVELRFLGSITTVS